MQEIKKITCPSCGKELISLGITATHRNTFYCDDCHIDFEIFADNTMTMSNDRLLAEWYNADEGICGDYNADDPEDINLLRFDVSHNTNPPEESEQNWEQIEDASYCTQVDVDTPLPDLIKLLWIIFKEYSNVLDAYLSGSSVKKLGEGLSYISGCVD